MAIGRGICLDGTVLVMAGDGLRPRGLRKKFVAESKECKCKCDVFRALANERTGEIVYTRPKVRIY